MQELVEKAVQVLRRRLSFGIWAFELLKVTIEVSKWFKATPSERVKQKLYLYLAPFEIEVYLQSISLVGTILINH